ncbi:MAG: FHA domain-containing protein [Planctomycetota bacterium]
MTTNSSTWHPRLLVAENGALSVLPLDGEQWLVGRGEDCDLRLLDARVSRKHALLYRKGARLFLRDLGARNQILRNERPIERETLELFPGDRLLLGETLLVYQGELRGPVDPDEDTRDDPERNGTPSRAGEEALYVLGKLTGCIGAGEDEACAGFLDLLVELLPCRLAVVAGVGQDARVLAARGYGRDSVTLPLEVREQLEGTRAALCLHASDAWGLTVGVDGALGPDGGVFAAPLLARDRLVGATYLERDWPSSTAVRDRDLTTLRHLTRLLSGCLDRLRRIHELEERDRRMSLPGTSSWIQDGSGKPPRLATLSEVEREHIRYVLHTLDGHRENCARILGIATSTLYDKLRRHGITDA